MNTFKQRVTYVLLAVVVLGLGLHTSEPESNGWYFCDQPAVAQELNTESVVASGDFAPVQLILQNPALPNGCEVTSLAMALTAAGYPADHVTLYETALPKQALVTVAGKRYGDSPDRYYIGDATQAPGGWYCFEQPIIEAGNTWISENGGGAAMVSLSGMDRETLIDYAKAGVPVVAWVTLEYDTPNYLLDSAWILPDGTEYTPYSNLHCVVVTGFENGFFRIADPLSGWQFVKKDVFWQSFDAMGRRAVVVEPDGAEEVTA